MNTQSQEAAYVKGQTQGLPASAKARLADGRAHLWTSDLSVNEFLLVRDAGFSPLGLVMGCSIYHIGFQFTNPWESLELDVLTQALYSARELAMTRMQEEADLLGADGIVGVRLTVNRHAFGANLAEFLAIGTAIKHDDGGDYRTKRNKPFTSDLSGQDFWTLLRSGYRPVSLVIGNCVYQVRKRGMTQALGQIGQNVEMDNYTQGLYDARELAIARMQAEAEADGAQGIVGVEVEESSHGWNQHVIEYFALGTSIIEISSDHAIQTPQLVLSLGDASHRIGG